MYSLNFKPVFGDGYAKALSRLRVHKTTLITAAL